LVRYCLQHFYLIPYLAEIKTAVALAYRLSADPPLAERCKHLFAAFWSQLLPPPCLSSPQEHTQTSPSPMEEDSIHRDAKTVPMQSVVANPFGAMRRRRGGYSDILDDG